MYLKNKKRADQIGVIPEWGIDGNKSTVLVQAFGTQEQARTEKNPYFAHD